MEPRSHKPQLVAITAASPFVADTRPRSRLANRDREEPLAKRRFWLFDPRRREEAFASETAFLISAVLTIVGSGVFAYYYALWTIPGAS